MKRSLFVACAALVLPVAGAIAVPGGTASADPLPPTSAVVYDATTNPLVPMVSEAFEATSTSEFGNEISFATSQPALSGATVTMDSWACQSGSWADATADCVTTPGSTFPEPVTLNLYSVGPDNTVGPLISSTTQTFNIPYRPSDAPSCSTPNNGEYLASNGHCAHGLPVNISFNLGNVTVPDSVIYGISYNTSGYGPDPYGYGTACAQTPEGCGYDSLNVALSSTPAPSVGTDPLPGSDFLDSTWGGAYCDNGANGTGIFRWDSVTQVTDGDPSDLGCVAGTDSAAGDPDVSNNDDYYIPAVQFVSYGVPTITGVGPSQGPNTGGTAVTVSGTNLAGASAVSFGASPAASYRVVSDTQITATSPAGAPGPASVSVTTPGGTATDTAAFTYLCTAPAITSAAAAPGRAGQAFSFTVTTCSTSVPVLKGSGFPTGLRLVNHGNGTALIGGTPYARDNGRYTATITASVLSEPIATQSFVITMDDTPAFKSRATDTVDTGVAFSYPVVTAYGYPVPTLTTTSTLPGGVTLTDNHNGTATLGGTPGPDTGGVYPITVTATNGIGAPVAQSFVLTVLQPPAITSAATVSAVAHQLMTPFPVTATGYPVPQITASGLPPGVTFSHGDLSGTPTTVGGDTVTITATSKSGTGTQAMTFTVSGPPLS
jgi:hypothetical protein